MFTLPDLAGMYSSVLGKSPQLLQYAPFFDSMGDEELATQAAKIQRQRQRTEKFYTYFISLAISLSSLVWLGSLWMTEGVWQTAFKLTAILFVTVSVVTCFFIAVWEGSKASPDVRIDTPPSFDASLFDTLTSRSLCQEALTLKENSPTVGEYFKRVSGKRQLYLFDYQVALALKALDNNAVLEAQRKAESDKACPSLYE